MVFINGRMLEGWLLNKQVMFQLLMFKIWFCLWTWFYWYCTWWNYRLKSYCMWHLFNVSFHNFCCFTACGLTSCFLNQFLKSVEARESFSSECKHLLLIYTWVDMVIFKKMQTFAVHLIWSWCIPWHNHSIYLYCSVRGEVNQLPQEQALLLFLHLLHHICQVSQPQTLLPMSDR